MLAEVAHDAVDVVGALARTEGHELHGEILGFLVFQRGHAVEARVTGAVVAVTRTARGNEAHTVADGCELHRGAIRDERRAA
ncbi:MAG TPA: hypothetical protein VGK70_09660 [Thermoanaerobaculia bacterium]